MALQLPECWDDDERMNFLFQPFRERSVNPISYDAKMKFWKTMIAQYLASETSRLTICLDDLCIAFTRKGVSPKCLSLVIDELIKEETLVEFEDYQLKLSERVARQNSGWASWGYQVMVSSPIKQFANRVVSVVSPKPKREKYLAVDNLKTISKRLLQSVQDDHSEIPGTYRLLQSYTELTKKFPMMHPKTLELSLLWLESEKLVCKLNEDDEVLYKFSEKKLSAVKPPTEVEVGVWKLNMSKRQLDLILENTQSSIDNLNLLIRDQVRQKNRPVALSMLRKRKGLEKVQEKNLDHHIQIDSILNKIYNSSTTALVLDAFKSGANALNTTNQQTSMTDVQKTLDALQEATELSKEIEEALSTSIADDEYEGDVEDELADLLNEDEPKSDDTDDLLLRLNKLSTLSHLPIPGAGDTENKPRQVSA